MYSLRSSLPIARILSRIAARSFHVGKVGPDRRRAFMPKQCLPIPPNNSLFSSTRPAACQKVTAVQPMICGTSQFHSNMTAVDAAPNTAMKIDVPIRPLRNLFFMVSCFCRFVLRGRTFARIP